MSMQERALPRLSTLLPALGDSELKQIVNYTDSLSDEEAASHLQQMLDDSPQALEFIIKFSEHRAAMRGGVSDGDRKEQPMPGDPSNNGFPRDIKSAAEPDPVASYPRDLKSPDGPANGTEVNGQSSSQPQAPLPPPTATSSEISKGQPPQQQPATAVDAPPIYAPPPISDLPSSNRNVSEKAVAIRNKHTNAVIEAAKLRSRDETDMQNHLQRVQLEYNIYNPDIEPEHEADFICNCSIHQYQWRKWQRYGVQNQWSKAVMYPGEKAYDDNNRTVFNSNPYTSRFGQNSPYGWQTSSYYAQRPIPRYYTQFIHRNINLNNALNAEAQNAINAKEPSVNIWGGDREPEIAQATSQMNGLNLDEKRTNRLSKTDEKVGFGDKKIPIPDNDDLARERTASSTGGASQTNGRGDSSKSSRRMSSFRKSLGIKTSEEKAANRSAKVSAKNQELRGAILLEEQNRWPDGLWRQIVLAYQDKVGMTGKIADLRRRFPIQYLHLLRAGYFEPIPVAWATQLSNPLKFSIDANAGWRGITPAWRGYEDTAEERLYWVLNHREGAHVVTRLKPDFISEMNMARVRMAKAVEPPPQYFSDMDTCHIQHTSEGYSRQVMPAQFVPHDSPRVPDTDDTMILLDVSGSMDFDPIRPVYNEYLVSGYVKSTQPKNKDVAKAVIRRFTDSMANIDHHTVRGYDLITFSNQGRYVGTVNHQNLEGTWKNLIRFGGGTRVMTGWQMVKEHHFQKHSESAIHHPIYGWQAGPQTPMLRLLLLLDGEAQDMDEFELDLLSLSWAHVTIFLIGVDGCPHHHRHANELQRISDVNHHVSFVDAQGNTPERFVTHELLKRHLGYEMTMQEFESVEELPSYEAVPSRR